MNTMGAVMLIVSMFYLLLTICILYVSCKYVLPILIMYHTVKGVKEKEKRFVIFVNLLLTICILYVSCKYVLPILIMYHTVKGVKEKEKRFVIFVNFSNYLARIPGSNDHL